MRTFKLNDRVSREVDIFNPDKGIKKGIIIKRYSKPAIEYPELGITLGPYPELYAVLWDSGKLENGFLPHGLTKEK